MRTDEQAFEDRLRSLSRIEDPAVVREELRQIRPEDIAEALTRLDPEERLAILRHLEPDDAAYVLVELPTETARSVVSQLPDTTIAHYLDILPMDDAIELREELDPNRFEALLHVIPREDALEIRRLLSYPEDSAGQLMTEDFVEVRPDATMGEVLQVIRETPEGEFEMVNYIYVLDEAAHLLGVLSLKRVIRSHPGMRVADAMKTDVLSVSTDTPEEEVARLVGRYGILAMPVLDERGRMVGIVTADDAHEVLEEADTQDVLALGAVGGDAEPYLSLGTFQLIKRRLPWLLVLFLAEFLTGSVLRYYVTSGEDAAERRMLTTLMLFVPMLIGAGGNSGAQVTTTITRALAVGEVRTKDGLRVLRREFVVALAIGAILGLVGFLRAYFGWSTEWRVALIVGLALPAIILWATAVGSVLPLAAKRIGLDPAVMSAPFITTLVDATGMIIYFEIARLLVTY